jgi:hypothetical protein
MNASMEHGHLDPRPSAGPGLERELWLRGRALGLGPALADLGSGLVRELCPAASPQVAGRPLELVCRGAEPSALLLSWIETLLYVLDARQASLSGLAVEVGAEHVLKARCRMLPFLGGHLLQPHGLDAATARVSRKDDGIYSVECKLILPSKGGLWKSNAGGESHAL